MRVKLCLLAGSALLTAGSLHAQSIYSYVDANGVKVFTNIGSSRARSALAPTAGPGDLPAARANDYSALIHEMSARYGVSSELISAVIRVESDFDRFAVSVKDCKGLMQLHPDTAHRFGVRDVFDPRQNIEGGVRYLSFLLDEFELDLDRALAAYNAGEGAVKRFDGIPPYRETRDYVRKVRSHLRAGRAVAAAAPISTRARLVESEDGLVFTNLPVAGSGSH